MTLFTGLVTSLLKPLSFRHTHSSSPTLCLGGGANGKHFKTVLQSKNTSNQCSFFLFTTIYPVAIISYVFSQHKDEASSWFQLSEKLSETICCIWHLIMGVLLRVGSCVRPGAGCVWRGEFCSRFFTLLVEQAQCQQVQVLYSICPAFSFTKWTHQDFDSGTRGRDLHT